MSGITSKCNKMFHKKYMRVGGLLLVLMLMLCSCGASSKEMAAMDYASAPQASVEYSSFGGNEKFEVTEDAAAEMEAVKTEEGSAADTGKVKETDRKLIKTVDMNVETQSFDELLDIIQSRVDELGGYIESMNTYNGSKYRNYTPVRNAEMTLRIPKEKLDFFLEEVSGISNVVRRTDTVEDVTLAYVDLASHRDALRTEQTRLLELLEKAESVDDIITIEQRLSQVRYQLESMESQLRTYDNQVDYSTVYLRVEEVEIFTPIEEESAWQRISEGFVESLDNVGEGFVEFGIWFLVNIPYLVVWAVILTVGCLILIRIIRHRKRQAHGRPGKKAKEKESLQADVQDEEKQEDKNQ